MLVASAAAFLVAGALGAIGGYQAGGTAARLELLSSDVRELTREVADLSRSVKELKAQQATTSADVQGLLEPVNAVLEAVSSLVT